MYYDKGARVNLLIQATQLKYTMAEARIIETTLVKGVTTRSYDVITPEGVT